MGQERPAIDRAQKTGELAALSADLEAPGTTSADATSSVPTLDALRAVSGRDPGLRLIV